MTWKQRLQNFCTKIAPPLAQFKDRFRIAIIVGGVAIFTLLMLFFGITTVQIIIALATAIYVVVLLATPPRNYARAAASILLCGMTIFFLQIGKRKEPGKGTRIIQEGPWPAPTPTPTPPPTTMVAPEQPVVPATPTSEKPVAASTTPEIKPSPEPEPQPQPKPRPTPYDVDIERAKLGRNYLNGSYFEADPIR